jgi:chemotaxis protein CheD
MPVTQWVIPPPKKSLVVRVADMVASNDPSAELVTYSLGSCLGITIYDPVKKVGGLLHLMLPDSKIDPAKAAATPFMFVDSGVPRLFAAAYSLGADRSRIIIKVAGGAQLLDPGRTFNIGERNFQAFSNLIARNGLYITAQDVGGLSSRTLRFDNSNGNVSIQSPGATRYNL